MDNAIDELLKKVAAYAGVKPPQKEAITKKTESENTQKPTASQFEDIKETGYPLRIHSAITSVNGDSEVSENLLRAAEFVTIPSDVILKMQRMMRPNGATLDELTALADELESNYFARLTAKMVRDVLSAYRISGMLK